MSDRPGSGGPRSRRRAVAGTVAFALVGPPAVAVVLVPWLITRWRLREALWFGATRWVGVALLASGLVVAASAMAAFPLRGRGTPLPAAAPVHLVVSGPNRYVRNPMYVGILLMVAGQGLVFGSWPVLVYAAVLSVVFHLFVVGYEEPTLRRTFGDEYVAYCRRVGRWIPHPH